MRYQIVHTTRFVHDAEVSASHHVARLEPRQYPGQACVEHALSISPAPRQRSVRVDYFGNRTATFSVESPYRTLEVTARSVVERSVPDAELDLGSAAWDDVHAGVTASTPESPEWGAREYVCPSPLVARSPDLADYARQFFSPGCPLAEAAGLLMGAIHRDFAFDPTATTVATPLDEVFRMRRGVCQDFAHLMIGCLRSLGLPARYVSGYIETLPPPGAPKLVGVDASHAWVSVFCPPYGWVDLDPTNDGRASERHIAVAWGRDFSDVSPLRGIFVSSGHHDLQVAVDVTRLE